MTDVQTISDKWFKAHGLLSVGFISALLFTPAAIAGEGVETVDARWIDAKIIAVTAEKVELRTAAGTRTIALRDVAAITLGESQDPMGTPGRAVLISAAGDVIPVTGLAVAGGKVSFYSSLLHAADMKLKLVRAIYLPSASETAESVRGQCAKLKLPELTKDALIIQQEKKRWTAAGGVLAAVGEEKVSFRWKDTDRTIDRSSVRVIRLASVGKALRRPAGTIIGRKGAAVAFSAVKVTGDTVVVRTICLGERKIPRDRVAAIRLRSDRVVRLTDLKPVAVKEVPFFDMKFPHRLNRSVGGGPLQLGGRGHDNGLGLHSFCELTYRIDGKFKMFVATVGIDDAVRPAGDAVLTFLGDGKPLGPGAPGLRLTGKTKPARVRLKVAGVKRFTIRVGYGHDKIDAADHVDLVAPRLIK